MLLLSLSTSISTSKSTSISTSLKLSGGGLLQTDTNTNTNTNNDVKREGLRITKKKKAINNSSNVEPIATNIHNTALKKNIDDNDINTKASDDNDKKVKGQIKKAINKKKKLKNKSIWYYRILILLILILIILILILIFIIKVYVKMLPNIIDRPYSKWISKNRYYYFE